MAETSEAESVALGRQLVLRNCGMCHAVGRVGPSPAPGAPPFRDLHRRFKVEDLGEALAEGILTGHPSMPEFRFEPGEVIAIIRYLQSIQSEQKAQVAVRTPWISAADMAADLQGQGSRPEAKP